MYLSGMNDDGVCGFVIILRKNGSANFDEILI